MLTLAVQSLAHGEVPRKGQELKDEPGPDNVFTQKLKSRRGCKEEDLMTKKWDFVAAFTFMVHVLLSLAAITMLKFL